MTEQAELLAAELRKSIVAQTEANHRAAKQLEALVAEVVTKAKASNFHRHTDKIVNHFTDEIHSAMAQVFEADTIRQAIRAAYVSQDVAKADHNTIRQFALEQARAVLTAAKRALGGLIAVLRRLYGNGALQGTHWAAEAADGWVTGPLAQIEADVPADYWDEWKPGWGEAAALAVDGGLAQLLSEVEVRIQGITDTLLDRIGNAIADAVAAGEGVKAAASRVDAIVHDAKRAWLIADTELARVMVRAALQQYGELGLQEWDWVTAADPCARCAHQAALNPHLVGSVPTVPLHPACRCAPIPCLEDADE